MPLEGDLQHLNPGPRIDLFELDLSPIDPAQTVPLRWSGSVDETADAGAVLFRGFAYSPLPITLTGMAVRGRGAQPRPTLRVSNINQIVTGLLQQNGDLIGAYLKRIRTYTKYLDGKEQADPLATVAEDLWILERVTGENPAIVEIELVSAMDLEGKKLPNRTVYHNACPWVYEGLVLGIGDGECSYNQGGNRTEGGPNMFDINDAPTEDPTLDVCGKKLRSCKLRFGVGATLPYGGFPGAQRLLR